jgi:hypothetical protein
MLLSHFRVYSTQTTLLVVQKSEKTKEGYDQVIDNIAQLPGTLAFYDRLLQQFPEVKDPWASLSSEKRRSAWAQEVEAHRLAQSGMISLSIDANTAFDAKNLATRVNQNLFGMIGQYYNVRTEIDVRAVDAVITTVRVQNPFGWFLASVSAGFVASSVVSSILMAIRTTRLTLPAMHFGKKERALHEDLQPLVPVTFATTLETLPQEETYEREGVTQETAPEHISVSAKTNEDDAMEFAWQQAQLIPMGKSWTTETVAPEKQPVEPKRATMPTTSASQEEAQDALSSVQNLPFLEEGMSLEEHLFGQQAKVNFAKNEIEILAENTKKMDTQKKEPTPEELKQRLNQLLHGDDTV